MLPARFAPILDELAPLVTRFRERGHRLYLVGGSVRDLLVQHDRQDFDLDLTTDARPGEIKACLDGWADAVWTQGEKFGTIGAHKHDSVAGSTRVYEITTFRAEAYTDDSRKPHVVFADDIEVDLSRRDFTVNAMALELTVDSGVPALIDPFGGAADLATRDVADTDRARDQLRRRPAAHVAGGPLHRRLSSSSRPTSSRAAVTAMAGRLEIVSPERIRDEFDKLITVDHPSAGLWFLVDTGLADQFLPELPAMRLEHDPIHRHKDVLTHTIAVVENVRRVPRAGRAFDFRLTRLAALFHDIGKPRTRGYLEGKGTTFHHHDAVGARMTRKRMTAMRYSNDDVAKVSELVALHLRFHTYAMGWSDSAVRRYVRDAGALLAELNVLTRCDCTTRNETQGGPAVAADGRARRAHRRAGRGRGAGGDPTRARRQRGDASSSTSAAGRVVGEAMNFLLEIRLDEGVLGDDEIRRRLLDWWRASAARLTASAAGGVSRLPCTVSAGGSRRSAARAAGGCSSGRHRVGGTSVVDPCTTDTGGVPSSRSGSMAIVAIARDIVRGSPLRAPNAQLDRGVVADAGRNSASCSTTFPRR